MDGLKFVRQEEIAPGVHAFFFAGDGRAVAVLAPRPGHADFTLPTDASVQIRDLWNNPVAPGDPMANGTVLLTRVGELPALAKLLRP